MLRLQGALFMAAQTLRRAQLRFLGRDRSRGTGEGAPQSAFRIQAWRWHHLAVSRDLRRLERAGNQRAPLLCSSRTERVGFLAALEYILRDNWDVHDIVEAGLFIPFVLQKASRSVVRDAGVVAMERARLVKERAVVRERVERWVDVEPARCIGELAGIADDVRRLKRSADVLFAAAERAFVPCVRTLFSEQEQKRFNDSVLKTLSGRQLRVSLVVFQDAIGKGWESAATEEDRVAFGRDVPGHVRMLVPFWKRKFVQKQVKFLQIGTP